jgi:hypothetical protein
MPPTRAAGIRQLVGGGADPGPRPPRGQAEVLNKANLTKSSQSAVGSNARSRCAAPLASWRRRHRPMRDFRHAEFGKGRQLAASTWQRGGQVPRTQQKLAKQRPRKEIYIMNVEQEESWAKARGAHGAPGRGRPASWRPRTAGQNFQVPPTTSSAHKNRPTYYGQNVVHGPPPYKPHS